MSSFPNGDFDSPLNIEGSMFDKAKQLEFPRNLPRLDGTFNGDITDGYTRVEAVAVQPDGKIIVGGNFPRVNGIAAPGLARLNVDGSLDPTFNSGPSVFVSDIVIQPDGKILVAGFSTGIARLNSDGTLDPTFTPGTGTVGGVLDILLLPDGKILISGGFTQFNGTTISRMARLNANGTLDTSFTPPVISSSVYETARQSDGKFIIVGGFTTVGGITRRGVARLETAGPLDASLDAGTTLTFNRPSVAVQSDGKILVGGTSSGLVRLDPNGTLDPLFTPSSQSGFTGTTHRIVVLTDGKILAGGALGQEGGALFSVVKFNSNGSPDTGFTQQQCIDGGLEVFSIDLTTAGKIVAVGDLYKFGTIASINKRIARLNTDGTIDSTFVGSIEGYGVVNAVVQQPDGKILVGGDFASVNGSSRRNIARFNLNGTVDTSFTATTNGGVFTIALQSDGKILIGGEFSQLNGNSSGGAARLNADGTVDPTFDRTNFDSQRIYKIAIQSDGKILAGGFIFTVSGSKGIIRVNSNGSLDGTFTLSTTSVSVVYAISLLTNGQMYVGGQFNNYAASGRNRIVRLNSTGTVDSTFDTGTGPNSSVRTIALQQDGKVLIGGDFTTFNAVNAGRIARINANGTLDVTFLTGLGFDNSVYDLFPQQGNGSILVGGFFTSANGTSRTGLARLNVDGSLNTLDENVNSNVRSIALQADGKILIGGGFIGVGGQGHNAIARLDLSGVVRTPFDFDGDGKTDLSIFRPNGAASEWWWLKSSTGGNAALQFGASTDRLAPVDFTGDGKTDVAFWRPVTGQWFVLRSEDFSFYAFPFGANGDVPVPADYDGDGKADAAVYRPSTVTWFISRSTGGTTITNFGAAGDLPANADYDGDGKNDIAIFRPSGASGAEWWIRRSSNASVFALGFGTATDNAVVGDYTGDGKADVAFWRPSTGFWNVLRSEDFSYYAFPFGANGDVAVPGDYDGDGKLDAAVFRPSNSTWFANRSTTGVVIQQFGIVGDLPVPNAFVR